MESRDSNNWFWLVLAVVLVFGIVAVSAAVAAPFGSYYGMMGGGAAWGWGILMMAIPALILIVVLLALFGGVREPTDTVLHPAYTPPPANALDTLDLRYARGELSRDDYLRVRGDLRQGSSQP